MVSWILVPMYAPKTRNRTGADLVLFLVWVCAFMYKHISLRDTMSMRQIWASCFHERLLKAAAEQSQIDSTYAKQCYWEIELLPAVQPPPDLFVL